MKEKKPEATVKKITTLSRAYRSLKGVQATRRSDGLYFLSGKTYFLRHRLKAHGGRWDPERRAWIVSREAAEEVGALFRTRVRVAAHCHAPEEVICVSHEEAEAGIVRLGCGRRDSSFRCGDDVPILEVLGEVVDVSNKETK